MKWCATRGKIRGEKSDPERPHVPCAKEFSLYLGSNGVESILPISFESRHCTSLRML